MILLPNQVFCRKFSDSIKNTFLTIGKRFSYGGDTGKDQRVYYINTKEITDNKFEQLIQSGSVW